MHFSLFKKKYGTCEHFFPAQSNKDFIFFFLATFIFFLCLTNAWNS